MPDSASSSGSSDATPSLTQALEEVLAAPANRRRHLLTALPAELRGEVERLAGIEKAMPAGFLGAENRSDSEAAAPLPAAIDRYELKRRLARTAFSQVFVARDMVSRRRVALKLLPPFGAEYGLVRKLFFREIRALQELKHPNVVVIHESGECREGLYIVMELLRGRNLGDWLSDDSARPYADRLAVLRQTAVGLECVHAAGMVHGDVKPSNVFVENGGNVKLLDFGTTRRLESLAGSLSSRVGTPAYIAPEVLQAGKLSVRADMFSFGVLAFETITGANPLRCASLAETFRAVMESTLPASEIRGAGASPSVTAVLERCLDKEASGRPGSFSEIIRALDA